jgi:hypothetical protein
MSVERQQAARRYLVVIQDERGYPPPGEQDKPPPDGPAPPMMHTAVLATDYDALHAALEVERGLREKAEQERDEWKRAAERDRERAEAPAVIRYEQAEQRAAVASQRLEEAAKVIGWIRRDRREPDKVLMYCETVLARESSEEPSSGPDGTDESERNER